MLERSASADLFKNTLSRIPTIFGRLFYLASLRDPHSGFYEHHGLRVFFGKEESRRALLESHLQVFQTWLNLPMQDKADDLRSYLESLEEGTKAVKIWAETQTYRLCLPVGARESEKELFLQEFDALLKTFPCD